MKNPENSRMINMTFIPEHPWYKGKAREVRDCLRNEPFSDGWYCFQRIIAFKGYNSRKLKKQKPTTVYMETIRKPPSQKKKKKFGRDSGLQFLWLFLGRGSLEGWLPPRKGTQQPENGGAHLGKSPLAKGGTVLWLQQSKGVPRGSPKFLRAN